MLHTSLPFQGNVINLRIKLHFSKKKCAFVLKNQISTTNGKAECYPAAMGGSLTSSALAPYR
ncbi:MAG: hypothetical protein LUD82_01015, partial [Clostridiales bacterium]|nr:hypothetical protein [Clostridiales bacterium]